MQKQILKSGSLMANGYWLVARSGFSLLEVIIVIAITALLAGLTAGFYGNFTKSVDIDLAAKTIVSDLKIAQAKAMSGSDANGDGVADKWGICFINPSGAGGDLYELYSAPDMACAVGGSVTKKITTYLPSGITFDTPGDSAAISVVFSKITGEATITPSSTIVITGNNQTKTITIGITGLISIN